MKQNRKWTRLTALALALTLFLTGCAASVDGGSAGNESQTTAPPQTTAPASTPSEEPSAAPSVTPEEERLLARTGLAEVEVIEISEEEGAQITRAAADMWRGYVAGPNGEDPLVESRDWSIYSSSFGQENLSKREAELFKRLDKMCLKYLSTSGLDGVKYSYDGGERVYYATDSVRYSDLGLSRDQAKNVYCWFRYNNPQYYFLAYACLSNNSSLFPCMFEIMSDGEDRAEITNELFDKLEGWIQDAENEASTTYQKELYVNNLLCVENEYERQYEKPPEGGQRYDQSLYSSVLLGKTVCAGYAMAFCAMMNAMDVDATAGVSLGHAWNVVRMEDGNCYAVDVCWNDTDSNPPYENDYLNVGDAASKANDDDEESHTYREDFAAWIPVISQENYEPTAADTQTGGGSSGTSNASPSLNAWVTEVGPTSIGFAWNEVEGDHVLYSVTYEVDGTRITGNPHELIYRADQLTPDTEYTFWISWKGLDGKGGVAHGGVSFSVKTLAAEAETVTLDPSSSRVPSAPAEVTMFATSTDEARTEWAPVPGATEYDIYMYEDSSYSQIDPEQVETWSADEGAYMDWSGAAQGETYYMGVRARTTVNGVGICSGWTNFSYTHE